MIRSLPVCAALLAVCVPAAAQAPPAASPAAVPVQGPTEGNSPGAPAARGASPAGATTAGETAAEPPFANRLLGDPFGGRTALAGYGVSLGLTEISEVFGNVTGGLRRGAAYEGVAEFGLGLDTEKLLGFAGGTFNVTAYHDRGRGVTADVGALTTITGVEQSARGAKLFELWYEQVLFGKTLAVRVGQMSADQEFITTEFGGLFLNAGYGFPTLASNDLPSGGPAYPLATLGVRVKYVPSESVAVLAAVFNGDPAGPGNGDPQRRDGGGTALRVNDGTFAIAEVQYTANAGANAPGLSGTYKIGGWYNSLPFADQRTSFTGRSLADPANTAAARARRNAYSVYAVVDQLVWRKPDSTDGGVAVFGRAMAAPSDRTLIDAFVQGGVSYKAPFAGRDNDSVGFAVSWSHISQRAAKLDSDRVAFTGVPGPVRRSETQLELTYQAQLAAWCQLQPDAQYILNPGGGVTNPRSGKRVGDAALLGLRTTITF